jgi:glycerol-3-phosphate dehydrogenase
VARQLSDNYGDRAWTVCALAESTGEQWPVHGVRLSSNHFYVEAEVLYATRHEYACTAVDVLARRTRLAFVDAQAALAALPRVIEIMSKELGWSRARQRAEYARGVQFLGSMGLAPGSAVNNATATGWEGARSWRTWFEGGFWRLVGLAGVSAPSGASSSLKLSYSRTKFDAGEVDALRELYDQRVAAATSSSLGRLNKAEIEPALKAFAREWPGAGYEGFREADYRYVFAQEGLEDWTDVDFDEFVEVGSPMRPCLVRVTERAPDLWKLKGRVHDERGQNGQEGAETDTCREERWRGVVVGCIFLYFSVVSYGSCRPF